MIIRDVLSYKYIMWKLLSAHHSINCSKNCRIACATVCTWFLCSTCQCQRLMFLSSPPNIIPHSTANQTLLPVTELSDGACRQICERLKWVRATQTEKEREGKSGSPRQQTPAAPPNYTVIQIFIWSWDVDRSIEQNESSLWYSCQRRLGPESVYLTTRDIPTISLSNPSTSRLITSPIWVNGMP